MELFWMKDGTMPWPVPGWLFIGGLLVLGIIGVVVDGARRGKGFGDTLGFAAGLLVFGTPATAVLTIAWPIVLSVGVFVGLLAIIHHSLRQKGQTSLITDPIMDEAVREVERIAPSSEEKP
jgi:hypothetical protein